MVDINTAKMQSMLKVGVDRPLFGRVRTRGTKSLALAASARDEELRA